MRIEGPGPEEGAGRREAASPGDVRSSVLTGRALRRPRTPGCRLPAPAVAGLLSFAICLLVPAALAAPAATSPPPEAIELFETRVRPLLAAKCYACHGPQVQQSGLRLDSRTALLQGGKRGPALAPGEPDRSLLLEAVRHTGRLKMPPAGRLLEAEVRALAEWVRLGAPWPGAARSPSPDRSRGHWAFQPVRRPPVPQVKNRAWVRNPIDAFLLARLEAASLAPSPPADRRTLIRRAYFDLIGLPPTAEEIASFESDRSPDAWEKVVDRLLASPHYGERWGRYWLDIARFSDTKGYVYTGERRYPFAYTYRDYVIRAFNEDLPYDRFLVEQIAADQLDLGEDKRPLAAMGFLTLGRRFVNMQPDIIDDRLDVIFRGTQALTVGCARCHDHKFDPIPTKDYYSLYGVLAGSTERTVQVVPDPPESEAFAAYRKELAERQRALEEALDRRCGELSDRVRRRIADYLAMVPKAEKLPGEEFYVIMGADDINPILVRSWRAYLDRFRDGLHPIWGPWHAFERLSGPEWSGRARELARRFAANADGRLNRRVAALFDGEPPASMAEVTRRYGALLTEVDTRWRELTKVAKPAPERLPDPAEEELRQELYSPASPASIPRLRISETEYYFDEGTRNELNGLQAKVDQWQIQSPLAPPHALAMEDLLVLPEPRVFLRGNPSTKGDRVPRQFLAVLSGPNRRPFQHGSGRLELARAIADRNNPLTARVMVNRVWMYHFGQPIVRTPSDFGTRSEPPTHPELLDWLASTFSAPAGPGRVPVPRIASAGGDRHTETRRGERAGETSEGGADAPGRPDRSSPPTGLGWSLKRLHRLIMLSNAYRQSSAENAAAAKKDPENRLLWRMNRRRLDWEALRDTLLFASGELDLALGGPSVELFKPPFSRRRSVYGLIDRQNLPGTLRVFDFANPDRHSPQRYVTTSPQQALFLMNSPFVMERARAVSARAGDAPPGERIRRLYRFVLSRDPTPHETALGLRFLAGAGRVEGVSPWEQYSQALLLTNELVFVD